MNIFVSFLLSLVSFQAQYIEIKVINEDKHPIDGVYAQINNDEFLYSNSDGIIKIPHKKYGINDSIYFSHLSYVTAKVSIVDLTRLEEFPNYILQSDIKELNEVVISNFDEKRYVKEAIDLIPENYGYAFSPSSYFNANISLVDDDKSSKLIDYKGGLVLSVDEKKNLFVSKLSTHEFVVDNLKDYIFQVKPNNFTSIIGIGSHPVIRKYKNFTFTNHEYVVYKGDDAVKIHFEIDKKHGGQSGYLIINTDNKAIMSLCYKINPINEWIGAKTKRGVEKVSLIDYYVEANYSLNSLDKYIFDSGREKIVLKNKAGKTQVNTTSDVYLKRIENTINPETKVEIKNIF